MSGQIGVGKDYIIKHYLKPLFKENCMILGFADHLKVNVSSENNIDIEQCLSSRKPLSIRQKLQHEGTEKGRNAYGDDIWIRRLEKWIYLHQIKNDINIFIINDCRFLNEAKWIEEKMSGLLIKIDSPNRNKDAINIEANNDTKKYADISSHISENSLSNYNFKYILYNDYDNNDQEDQLFKILASAHMPISITSNTII